MDDCTMLVQGQPTFLQVLEMTLELWARALCSARVLVNILTRAARGWERQGDGHPTVPEVPLQKAHAAAAPARTLLCSTGMTVRTPFTS